MRIFNFDPRPVPVSFPGLDFGKFQTFPVQPPKIEWTGNDTFEKRNNIECDV